MRWFLVHLHSSESDRREEKERAQTTRVCRALLCMQ